MPFMVLSLLDNLLGNYESHAIDNDYLAEIGRGSEGLLHRVSKDKVAKFRWNWRWANFFSRLDLRDDELKSEYEVCRTLYENGVSVPRPHGVFRFRMPPGYHEDSFSLPVAYPAFVMDYIEGVTPSWKSMSNEEKKTFNALFEKEVDEVRKIPSLTPSDSEDIENVIWVPESNRVYLIDFGRWKFQEK